MRLISACCHCGRNSSHSELSKERDSVEDSCVTLLNQSERKNQGAHKVQKTDKG
jgi:hypothetical protein